MGYTLWSDAHYRDRAAHLAAAGRSAFGFDEDIRQLRALPGVHPLMDPTKLKGGRRESRDSAAHATSRPEVAGDAAQNCDPMSGDDIARSMSELRDDEALRERLTRTGNIRSERYTWDRTAEARWASFQRMTDGAA